MRKRRTREHVIADLSVNHVERFVLRGGHVADRVFFDYGYDLTIRTFNEQGEVEPDFLLAQLKASDALNYIEDERFVSVRIAEPDSQAWHEERVPVILIAYDAKRDVSYWLHFQSANNEGRTTVRIPTAQPLDDNAIATFRTLKNGIV